jgi:hypothetical protein
VGYAGGTLSRPTYQRMGDHSETVLVEYDPARIDYAKLLRQFLAGHDPNRPETLPQYRSVILTLDAEQERLARERWPSAAFGSPVYTAVEPLAAFTPAEDYHQKFYLQRDFEALAALRELYPSFPDLLDSTAAARVNAVLGATAPPPCSRNCLPGACRRAFPNGSASGWRADVPLPRALRVAVLPGAKRAGQHRDTVAGSGPGIVMREFGAAATRA